MKTRLYAAPAVKGLNAKHTNANANAKMIKYQREGQRNNDQIQYFIISKSHAKEKAKRFTLVDFLRPRVGLAWAIQEFRVEMPSNFACINSRAVAACVFAPALALALAFSFF